MSVHFREVILARRVDDQSQLTDDVSLHDEQVDFGCLMLSESVLMGLHKCGYHKPSPVQLKAIPLGRMGFDLVVQAKSGTGKTLVFTVLALEGIVKTNTVAQVLIVSHTREIATQIHNSLRGVGFFMKGLRICLCIGGTPMHTNISALKRGVHIVVGTPGRLCQLVKDNHLTLDTVRLFVVDEADKMMEPSYQGHVNWLFSMLANAKQVAVFSATYPRSLDTLLSQYMTSPTMVKLDSNDVQLVGIKQYLSVLHLPQQNQNLDDKFENVYQTKFEYLINLLPKISYNQALIFCGYQKIAEQLESGLKRAGFSADLMSGNLEQNKRNEVMSRLKSCKNRLLVTTDLTSRGIDAQNVNLVICFETPTEPETYFHRIGRAGRYGGYGAAITLAVDNLDAKRFYAIGANAVGSGDKGFNVKVLPVDLDDIPDDICNNMDYWNERTPVKFPSTSDRKAASSKKMNDKDFSESRLHPLEFLKQNPIQNIGDHSPAKSVVYSRDDFMKINADSNMHVVNGGQPKHIQDTRTEKSVFDPTDVDFFDDAAPAVVEGIFAPKSSCKSNKGKMDIPVNYLLCDNGTCSSSEPSSAASSYSEPSQVFYSRVAVELSATQPPPHQTHHNNECTPQKNRVYSREEFQSLRDTPQCRQHIDIHKDTRFLLRTAISPLRNSWYQRMMNRPVTTVAHKYSRNDLLDIFGSVDLPAWDAYAESQFDVYEEPFVKDRQMRGSFAQQNKVTNQRKRGKMVISEMKNWFNSLPSQSPNPVPDVSWFTPGVSHRPNNDETRVHVPPRISKFEWDRRLTEDEQYLGQLKTQVQQSICHLIPIPNVINGEEHIQEHSLSAAGDSLPLSTDSGSHNKAQHVEGTSTVFLPGQSTLCPNVIHYDHDAMLCMWSKLVQCTGNTPLDEWLNVEYKLKDMGLFVQRIQPTNQMLEQREVETSEDEVKDNEEEVKDNEEEVKDNEEEEASVACSGYTEQQRNELIEYENTLHDHYKAMNEWYTRCKEAYSLTRMWSQYNHYMDIMQRH